MIRKLLLILSLLAFPVITTAQESSLDLKTERINPGQSIYSIKRLVEKVQEKLTVPQEKKVAFEGKLLERRLSELNFLVNNKKVTPIERASQRFSAQAGVYVEGLEKMDSTNKEGVFKNFEDYKNPL